ncbi:hypothetical protein BDZ94DRAFT_1237980 [Collybia nuda]|uniref:DUF6534 domain-containing protein n=1 Tax=Collybia nuda TaxID=64659 RepID=A0A9P5Y2H3_9AGAR|nr:hypothetical protein BDZ94DRAFT_1237980 [Collybia nuda]
MASATTPTPSEIAKSTAPLLLGSILNWGLYGGLCVQSYYYYVAFPKDRTMVKALVYGLFLVETVQSILIAHDVFAFFAFGFGDFVAASDPHLTWLDGPVMTAIASCTVQIYFARQIYAISGSKLAGITIVLSISAIISGVKALQLGDLNVLQAQAHTTIAIWLVGSAVCDIIIAIFLVYFLSRKTTGFKTTQTLITKLMRLTIETGSSYTLATIAIVDVVLFLAFPENSYHVAPALILGKLYSNTLLTTLNSRLLIVNSRSNTSDELNSYRLENTGQNFVSSNQRMRIPGVNPRSKRDDTAVTVNIEREVWTNNIPMDRLDDQESTRNKVKAMEDLA